MNGDLNTYEIQRLDEFELAKKLDDRCNVDNLANVEVGILMAIIVVLFIFGGIWEYLA